MTDPKFIGESHILPQVDMLSTLAALHGTDKVLHRYTEKYDRLLVDYRDTLRNMLEIGVDYGKSLRMWKDYFPKATIHGIDIHERCLKYQDDRIHVHIGEQQDTEFLAKVATHGPFDLIVDDGSHDSHHQVTSFEYLFKHALAPDGIYIIEDLHDAAYYGLYGTDYNSETYRKHYALRYLRDLVTHVNACPFGWTPPDWIKDVQDFALMSYVAQHITSITFHRFLCVIHKGDNSQSSR